MAQTIKLKRSATAGNTPTTSQLALGELGINTTDGKLFLKKSVSGTESIVDVGGLPLSGGTLTGNLNLGDNVKAQFGASDDLQIYHDGNNSIISDVGTGHLNLRGTNTYLQNSDGTANYLVAIQGDETKLYFNNSAKIATTATGADITGVLTADGLTVDSTTGFSWLPVSTAGAKLGAIGTGSSVIFNTPSVNANYGSGLAIDGSYASGLSSVNIKAFGAKYNSYGSELNLFTSSGTSLLKRLAIASNGDISFYDSSGSSQNLFWDSSTSRLGLGTTAPSAPLAVHSALSGGGAIAEFRSTGNSHSIIDLRADGTGDPKIFFDLNGATPFAIGVDNSDGDKFKISNNYNLGTNDRLTIDSAGNINIGSSLMVGSTSAPTAKLQAQVNNTATPAQIATDSNAVLLLENTNASGSAGIRLRGGNGAGVLMYGENNSTDKFYLSPRNATEKAFTLDHVGNAVFEGTITANAGVVVDNITIDGNEIDVSSGSMTLDSASQIILDAAGGNFQFLKSGTEFARIFESGSDFYIYNPISDKDIKFYGNDGGTSFTALTLDMSAGGTAYFADDVRLTDNHAIRLGTDADIVFYHDNSNGYLENGTGSLTLDVAGETNIDSATSGIVRLKQSGTNYGTLFHDSNKFYIKSNISDGDLIFQGNDGGSAITALTLDMSAAGAATFNAGINVNGTVTANNLTMLDDEFIRLGNSNDFVIVHSSSENIIQAAVSDQDIIFKGNDGGSTITALTLDMSAAGAATFNSSVTADGLTVSGNITNTGNNYFADATSGYFFAGGGSFANGIYGYGTNNARIDTNSKIRINIASNGDISFYEDTGTTAKLFWDASAERLGIGSSSPSQDLEILNGTTGAGIRLAATGTAYWDIERDSTSGHLTFTDDGAGTVLTVGQDGNVGIGATGRLMSGYDGNSKTLTVYDSDGSAQSGYLELASVANNNGYNAGAITFVNNANSNNSSPESANSKTVAQIRAETVTSDNNAGDDAGSSLVIFTKPEAGGLAERARLTSDGNLLVGTSNTTWQTQEGLRYFNGSSLIVTRDSDEPMSLNRLTNDGDLLILRRNGTAVGALSTKDGDLNIGTGACGIRFNDGVNAVIPFSITNNFQVDNTLDLGYPTLRFKDLHLSGTANVGSEVVLADSGTPKFAIGNSSNDFYIYSNAAGSERMRIDSSGRVGIGTQVPDAKLSVTSSTINSEDILYLKSGADNVNDYLGIAWELGVGGNGPHSAIRTFGGPSGSDVRLGFLTTSDGGSTLTEALSVAHNGNVGIGTSSPTVGKLQVNDGSGAIVAITRTSGATSGNLGVIRFGNTDIDSNLANITAIQDGSTTSSALTFETQSTGGATAERTRIASNGTLYHGKTADSLNTGGLQTLISGQTSITQSYTEPLRLNRMSSQGAIQKFYYNGGEVGSIQTRAGIVSTIVLDPRSGQGAGLTGAGAGGDTLRHITPTNESGVEVNGKVSLGNSINGFKDLHLSGKIYGSTLGIGDAGIQADQYSNAVKPFRPDITSGTSDNYLDLGTSSVRWVDIYATNGTIQTSDRNEKQDIEDLTEAEERVAMAAKGLLKKFRWKSAVEDKGDDARIHFGIIAQDLQDAFEAEGLDAGRYGMFISTTWTDEDGEEQTRMGVRYSELLAFIISAI